MNSLYKPSKWLILVLLSATMSAVGSNASELPDQANARRPAGPIAFGLAGGPCSEGLAMGFDGGPGAQAMGIGYGPAPMALGPGLPPPMMRDMVFIGPPGPPPPGMMLPLAEADLSDDQVAKIVKLKRELMEKVGPIMGKIHGLELDERSALLQPQVNASDVAAISAQISAAKQTLDSIFTEFAISSAQVLTPEQRQKLSASLNRRELGPGGFHLKVPTRGQG